MSKVIVTKNDPEFNNIELEIKITISTMEAYLAFKKDIKDLGEDMEFEGDIVFDLLEQLEAV